MNATRQYVATEGYPDGYMDNQDCDFNFVAPPGRKFIVTFEDFSLQEETDDDYITLFSDPIRDYLHFRELDNMDTGRHTYIHTYIHRHTHVILHVPTHYNKLNAHVLSIHLCCGFLIEKNTNYNLIQSITIAFHILASDVEFYSDPPTFRSQSNISTLKFTSDDNITESGILMAYILGKYLWLILFSFVNYKSLKIVTFTGATKDITVMDATYSFYLIPATNTLQTIVYFHFMNLDEDNCVSLPCENDGTCVDDHGCYMCLCTDQWLGENCTGISNLYHIV